MTAQGRGKLREQRRAFIGVFRELTCLRASQPEPLRQVTAKRDVGFVGLLVLLMSWGDTALPRDFLLGMPAVGTAPWHGVFPLQASREITRAEILADAQRDNARILQSLRPGNAFLLSQSQKDADAGFCTPPLQQAELLRRLKGRPYRLIPRCVITQSSGKQRVIDNADTGGQSAPGSDANELVLCTPLRPAQHAAAVVAAMSEAAFFAAQAGREAGKTGLTRTGIAQ